MGEYEKTDGSGEAVKVWIDEAEQIEVAKRLIMGIDVGVGTDPPSIAISAGERVILIDAGRHWGKTALTFATIFGSAPCEPFAAPVEDSFRALGEAAERASDAIRRWGDRVGRIDAITMDKVIDLKTVDDTNMRYADYWHQRDAYRPRAAAPRKPKRTRAYKGSSEAKKASRPRSWRRRSRRARK